MDYSVCFHDGNITDLINSRTLRSHHDFNYIVQMHSSLVRRLSLERELEGHHGCVNAITWNSEGSLLMSGSDDTRLNIWSYSSRKLLHSIETGHSANIFCTKFIPETSDELVVSGAGDAEVRLFNLSRLRRSGLEEGSISPLAIFQCHTRRVKKLAVEVGNPHVVWSASEDGTLRQHDFREGASCPPAGSPHQECRNILLDLRCGAKKSLADPPKQCLALKSCDISSTRPHLLLVGGSDTFARLYDRRMLPPLSSSQKKLPPPPCLNYFCPMHLSDLGRSSLHLTHVTFSPNGEEVLLSYSGEHVYLMDVNLASGSAMRYTSGNVSKLISLSPILDSAVMQSSVSGVTLNGFPVRKKAAAGLDKCRKLIQTAEKFLKGETDYYYGIEACNEVLDGRNHEIGPTLMHECLCIRASLLLKRRWKMMHTWLSGTVRELGKSILLQPGHSFAWLKHFPCLLLGVYFQAARSRVVLRLAVNLRNPSLMCHGSHSNKALLTRGGRHLGSTRSRMLDFPRIFGLDIPVMLFFAGQGCGLAPSWSAERTDHCEILFLLSDLNVGLLGFSSEESEESSTLILSQCTWWSQE
ncbi:UNVERIFIED_CONTAM: DDB1- and CUL4-associated factor 6 [Sesamum calycinum]|uniref:DDB1- and CUL4-associated factor 6 n=1 Tax=Sesamum calycinum TaxID=2727403 RepID=A0AAW2J4I9_9LAMI